MSRGAGSTYFVARWIVLRALGVWYVSIFVSLAFQIRGLIGPSGISPASDLFRTFGRGAPGLGHFWAVPSLLWIRSDDAALSALVVLGLASSLLLLLDVAPRAMLAASGVLFLSFASAADVFSEYQSDTMILEATAIGVVFAPGGLRPGLAAHAPPLGAALFLLRWEWFRIYFESGLVKLGSGDPTWRDFTAMDHYYENGPLPTWIGWHAEQLPHGFHAATVAFTLFVELVLVWLVFFPRRFRHACFVIVTLLQVGIVLTANYAFLNYLVLSLGVLLVDDEAFASLSPRIARVLERGRSRRGSDVQPTEDTGPLARDPVALRLRRALLPERAKLRDYVVAGWLAWIFYATIAGVAFEYAPPELSWLRAPAHVLEPFRVAGRYGLFAVMTPERYEIEFQGSRDGVTFVPYPFRFKPQDLREAPGIYAPYQPRFEWNLWFASLGSSRDNPWVTRAAACLLRGDEGVLALFRRDPFEGHPPRYVRAVLSQYWMTDRATRRASGAYWRRDDIGLYGPMLERTSAGAIVVAKERDEAPSSPPENEQ